MTQRIKIKSINEDPGISGIRHSINKEKVKEYKEIIKIIDPITVMKIDAVLYLVDGFHRVRAMVLAGWDEAEAYIERGKSIDEAYVRAIEINTKHGMGLTMDERHKACEQILCKNTEFSNRKIAKICGVGQKFVSEKRYDMEKHKKIDQTREVTGTDGKSYNIPEGRKNAKGYENSRKNTCTLNFASTTMLNEFWRIIKRMPPYTQSESIAQNVLYALINFESTMIEPDDRQIGAASNLSDMSAGKSFSHEEESIDEDDIL